jgi:hypothetical protein
MFSKAIVNNSYRSHAKIKISSDLLLKTINLLEHLDTDALDPDMMMLYGYVSHAFNLKNAEIDFKKARLKSFLMHEHCNLFDEQPNHDLFFNEPF